MMIVQAELIDWSFIFEIVPCAVTLTSFLFGSIIAPIEGWSLHDGVIFFFFWWTHYFSIISEFAYVETNLAGVMDDLCKDNCPTPERVFSEIIAIFAILWGVAISSFFMGLASNFHVVVYLADFLDEKFGHYKLLVTFI